jgi:gamma-glutamyltranspeptidase/glutathione hydrolase
MISTAHHDATDAGAEILADGGNAFDAAVAAAFALGVCEPQASGLGGQTMVLLHQSATAKTVALDGSSRAPHRATVETVPRSARKHGHRATTVPSTPATLRYLLERYGTMKLPRVLEPAIRLAENGITITPLQHALMLREADGLRKGTASAFYLRDGRRVYPTGSTLRQPVLAETLRRLAKRGVKDFYTGQVAKQIVADMEANDGLIRRDDLAQVPRPIERRAVTCRFEGLRIFSFPPPGAGRTLVEMLHVHQHLPRRYRDIDTPAGSVALARLIRQAFLDRQDRPFDPNYFAQAPRRVMLSEDYARQIARRIGRPIRSHGETTHLSAMDREGNVVALTQSIEKVFGSCAASPELGFLYNDYMSAFEYQDISHPYYLRPNAVPWASVAPTIVMRGRKPWISLGSPGSERITPSIVQVLLRIRLKGESSFAAVDAPRLHCSLKGVVALEASRMRDDIPEALEAAGFQLDERDPYSFYLGCVQLVMHERGNFLGVADPRRDGSARGPMH